MKIKKHGFWLVLVLLLAFGFIAWSIAYPWGTWRYKITVNVETPEGLKSGSAVREVTVIQGPEITPETTAHKKMRGEAVAVDLGKRGVLFALLGTDDYRVVFQMFPVPGYKPGVAGTSDSGIRYYRSLHQTEKKTLPLELHPRIVTFTDMNNPKTVTLVYNVTRHENRINGLHAGYTNHIEDHFQELFGEGVKIKDITVQITDEPATQGVVDKFLPENFKEEITDRWHELPYEERQRLNKLTQFKQGG